jgi:transcriptional regulator with XRE-family HTH domain
MAEVAIVSLADGAALAVGSAIRLARTSRGIPQHVLADKARLSTSRLSLIERERVLPSPAEHARIWGALSSE